MTISAFLNLLAWVVICSPSDAFLPTSVTQSKISLGYVSTKTCRYFFDFLKQNEPEKLPEKEPEGEGEAQEILDDPVDKIFGFFFGQKEDAPMGMKRFERGALFLNFFFD